MKQHSTNYYQTLITVAEDTRAVKGIVPPRRSGSSTVARMQFDMINDNPFIHTADDIIFNIHALRTGLILPQLSDARLLFFSKGQPCLRTSALAKRYGWGIYADQTGKIKLVDMASLEYSAMLHDVGITKIGAMRSNKRK
ncbi:MAG: DUF6157 family protein [Sphingobacterium sp.]